MPPKPRQVKIEQRSALAAMQQLEQRSDEELEREQKFKAAAQAILGARAAERYDAETARAHFRRAIAAARPQERMQLRRMADASLALAERRPDDLKEAVTRLGQAPPTSRQLFMLRLMGLVAPPQNAPWYLKARGILLIMLVVIVLLAVGFGIVKLISLPFGGTGTGVALLLGLLLVVVGARRHGPRRAKAPGEGAGRGARPATRDVAVCGRYSQTGPDPSVLRDRFPIGERVEVRRRFNVAPGDQVLAVTTDREGAPRGEVLRWGLVPHWADDPAKLGLKLINARSETMAEKPAFRDAFARRRCLVVADGFYEWEKRPDGTTQPWWVTRRDGEPFAFAGLWATWRGRPDVEPLRTCTIVTTRTSRGLAHIHDRMPVMLPPGAEAAWLDAATPVADLQDLCVPLEETGTRAVGTAVNDARYDGPDCLEPAPPPLTLF